MHRPTAFAFAGLGLSALTAGLCNVQSRLDALSASPRADPARLEHVAAELERVTSELATARAELDLVHALGRTTDALQARTESLGAEVANASCDVVQQRQRIESWEATRETDGARMIDQRLHDFSVGTEERWRSLGQVAHAAFDLAESTRHDLTGVEQSLTRDNERMWRDLVGPVVQLMGEETVGSGVLLRSEPIGDTDEFRTYVVTAWHVVRDILGGTDNVHTPVPVTIYGPDHRIWPETAELVNYDPTIDAALLKLNTTRKIEYGAALAPRERLAAVQTFEPIYAVGCPLGNDPIPTYGEIADTHHQVDGSHYWMISAPTYVGNSGGGIFDAKTHELLGIFSKIYTHGSIRPTVVPHMGLATPLTTIYDWLDTIGMASLEGSGSVGTAHVASARR